MNTSINRYGTVTIAGRDVGRVWAAGMKRLAALTLATIILAGCSTPGPTPDQTPADAAPVDDMAVTDTQAPPQDVPAGESALWNRGDYADGTPGTTWRVRLDGVTCGLPSLGEVPAAAGQELCRADLTVVNAGDVPDSPPDVGHLVVGGREFAPVDQSVGWDLLRSELGVSYSGQLNPGRESAWLGVWEVPAGSSPSGVWWPDPDTAGFSPSAPLVFDVR